MEGSWDRLGVLLAPLRPVSDRLSPPWGGPGEAPGGHFWRYFGVIFGSVLGDQAEKVKMSIFKKFNVILDPFSILFIALCCLPCCVAGGAAHMQNYLKSVGFCGSQAICGFFSQRPKQTNFRGHA